MEIILSWWMSQGSAISTDGIWVIVVDRYPSLCYRHCLIEYDHTRCRLSPLLTRRRWPSLQQEDGSLSRVLFFSILIKQKQKAKA